MAARTGRKGLIRGILMGLALAFVLVWCLLSLVWTADKPVAELRARWAQAPSTFIEIEGMSVHLRDEGWRDDPTPLVLLHGTSSSLHGWESWVARLKDQHRVISLDLPGFGLTGARADGDYSTAMYVRFMRAFMQRLGVQKVILVGNSMGGEIAWQVAANAPDRVKKLVLIDAAGYAFDAPNLPEGFRLARTPGLAWFFDHAYSDAILKRSLEAVFARPEKITPGMLERYRDMHLRSGNRAALRARLDYLGNGEAAAHIADLRLPTLILWGRKDTLLPVEFAQRFQRDIAGSKLIIFEELGHVPQEENPIVTLAAVRIFLNQD